MRLTFSGAAGCVTGSQHLLESGGKRFLLDCGMFQGRRKEAEKKNKTLPFDANSIDAVILSHAHIDHSGRLPFLVKNGFRGPIYTNPATIDLCHAMLRDTAHILESDAAFRPFPLASKYLGVALFTAIGNVPRTPPYTAAMLDSPTAMAETCPCALTVAIAGSEDDQLTLVLGMSELEPSDMVAVATRFAMTPTGMLVDGVLFKTIDATVAGMTVRVVDARAPLMVAVMLAVPAALAVARPDVE